MNKFSSDIVEDGEEAPKVPQERKKDCDIKATEKVSSHDDNQVKSKDDCQGYDQAATQPNLHKDLLPPDNICISNSPSISRPETRIQNKDLLTEKPPPKNEISIITSEVPQTQAKVDTMVSIEEKKNIIESHSKDGPRMMDTECIQHDKKAPISSNMPSIHEQTFSTEHKSVSTALRVKLEKNIPHGDEQNTTMVDQPEQHHHSPVQIKRTEPQKYQQDKNDEDLGDSDKKISPEVDLMMPVDKKEDYKEKSKLVASCGTDDSDACKDKHKDTSDYETPDVKRRSLVAPDCEGKELQYRDTKVLVEKKENQVLASFHTKNKSSSNLIKSSSSTAGKFTSKVEIDLTMDEEQTNQAKETFDLHSAPKTKAQETKEVSMAQNAQPKFTKINDARSNVPPLDIDVNKDEQQSHTESKPKRLFTTENVSEVKETKHSPSSWLEKGQESKPTFQKKISEEKRPLNTEAPTKSKDKNEQKEKPEQIIDLPDIVNEKVNDDQVDDRTRYAHSSLIQQNCEEEKSSRSISSKDIHRAKDRENTYDFQSLPTKSHKNKNSSEMEDAEIVDKKLNDRLSQGSLNIKKNERASSMSLNDSTLKMGKIRETDNPNVAKTGLTRNIKSDELQREKNIKPIHLERIQAASVSNEKKLDIPVTKNKKLGMDTLAGKEDQAVDTNAKNSNRAVEESTNHLKLSVYDMKKRKINNGEKIGRKEKSTAGNISADGKDTTSKASQEMMPTCHKFNDNSSKDESLVKDKNMRMPKTDSLNVSSTDRDSYNQSRKQEYSVSISSTKKINQEQKKGFDVQALDPNIQTVVSTDHYVDDASKNKTRQHNNVNVLVTGTQKLEGLKKLTEPFSSNHLSKNISSNSPGNNGGKKDQKKLIAKRPSGKEIMKSTSKNDLVEELSFAIHTKITDGVETNINDKIEKETDLSKSQQKLPKNGVMKSSSSNMLNGIKKLEAPTTITKQAAKLQDKEQSKAGERFKKVPQNSKDRKEKLAKTMNSMKKETEKKTMNLSKENHYSNLNAGTKTTSQYKMKQHHHSKEVNPVGTLPKTNKDCILQNNHSRTNANEEKLIMLPNHNELKNLTLTVQKNGAVIDVSHDNKSALSTNVSLRGNVFSRSRMKDNKGRSNFDRGSPSSLNSSSSKSKGDSVESKKKGDAKERRNKKSKTSKADVRKIKEAGSAVETLTVDTKKNYPLHISNVEKECENVFVNKVKEKTITNANKISTDDSHTQSSSKNATHIEFNKGVKAKLVSGNQDSEHIKTPKQDYISKSQICKHATPVKSETAAKVPESNISKNRLQGHALKCTSSIDSKSITSTSPSTNGDRASPRAQYFKKNQEFKRSKSLEIKNDKQNSGKTTENANNLHSNGNSKSVEMVRKNSFSGNRKKSPSNEVVPIIKREVLHDKFGRPIKEIKAKGAKKLDAQKTKDVKLIIKGKLGDSFINGKKKKQETTQKAESKTCRKLKMGKKQTNATLTSPNLHKVLNAKKKQNCFEKVSTSEVSSMQVKRNLPATSCGATLENNSFVVKENSILEVWDPDILKTKLYLEFTTIHRGQGAERLFNIYWEKMGRYLSFSYTPGRKFWVTDRCDGEGIDNFFNKFLPTRSLRTTHNKLILALMKMSLNEKVSASKFKRHAPKKWLRGIEKKRKIVSIKDTNKQQFHNSHIVHSDGDQVLLENLEHQFGACSDIWQNPSGTYSAIHANVLTVPNTGDIPNVDDEDDRISSSFSNLPGAISIAPIVKQTIKEAEMTISKEAIKVFVFAVREHASSVLRDLISSKANCRRDPDSPSTQVSVRSGNSKITVLDLENCLALKRKFGIGIMNTSLSRLGWERCMRLSSNSMALPMSGHLKNLNRSITNQIVGTIGAATDTTKPNSSVTTSKPTPTEQPKLSAQSTNSTKKIQDTALQKQKHDQDDASTSSRSKNPKSKQKKNTQIGVKSSTKPSQSVAIDNAQKKSTENASRPQAPRGRGRGVKDLSALRAASTSSNSECKTPGDTESSDKESKKSQNPEIKESGINPNSEVQKSQNNVSEPKKTSAGRGFGTKDLNSLRKRSLAADKSSGNETGKKSDDTIKDKVDKEQKAQTKKSTKASPSQQQASQNNDTDGKPQVKRRRQQRRNAMIPTYPNEPQQQFALSMNQPNQFSRNPLSLYPGFNQSTQQGFGQAMLNQSNTGPRALPVMPPPQQDVGSIPPQNHNGGQRIPGKELIRLRMADRQRRFSGVKPVDIANTINPSFSTMHDVSGLNIPRVPHMQNGNQTNILIQPQPFPGASNSPHAPSPTGPKQRL